MKDDPWRQEDGAGPGTNRRPTYARPDAPGVYGKSHGYEGRVNDGEQHEGGLHRRHGRVEEGQRGRIGCLAQFAGICRESDSRHDQRAAQVQRRDVDVLRIDECGRQHAQYAHCREVLPSAGTVAGENEAKQQT